MEQGTYSIWNWFRNRHYNIFYLHHHLTETWKKYSVRPAERLWVNTTDDRYQSRCLCSRLSKDDLPNMRERYAWT